MDYPDPKDAEGPEEIDPRFLSDPDHVRIELLLKNPSVARDNGDGTRTELAPDPRWLEWSSAPLVIQPENCGHSFSVCADCADSWGRDYYLRIFHNNEIVWRSPDHPDSVGDEGSPPLWNID